MTDDVRFPAEETAGTDDVRFPAETAGGTDERYPTTETSTPETDDAPQAEAPRPRRSVLYMPGANERALEKAKGLDADALILDLEDAVSPDAKEDARDRVCAAAASGEYGGREITIRVNGIDTEWHDADLRAAAKAGPDAVVVPKVNTARDVQNIERALELGGAPAHTKIWAMLETPVALLHAEEIASASDRLTVLVLGTNDLVKELHAEFVPGRAPLLGGLSLALLAARATGKVILDGVFNDVKDSEGFEAECLQGRQFGFDGKTLIHPGQLEPCNRVFAPSEAEVAHARKVIAAFEEARAAGQGVVTVDGRMIENLHVDNAHRVITLDAAINGKGSASTGSSAASSSGTASASTSAAPAASSEQNTTGQSTSAASSSPAATAASTEDTSTDDADSGKE